MSARPLRAFKARFDPELYEEIQTVSKLQRSSINQFVTTAVKIHLRESRNELITQYRSNLEKLVEYASKDPDFEAALTAFAAAETEFEDPLEGQAVESPRAEPSPADRQLEDIFESA